MKNEKLLEKGKGKIDDRKEHQLKLSSAARKSQK